MIAAYPFEQVWKFPLELSARVEVLIPDGFRVCHVGDQDGQLCAWAIVDPLQKKRPVKFSVVGTGMPIRVDGFGYIGTVIAGGGHLVWHVFMDGAA
jgi:hypothetical protein